MANVTSRAFANAGCTASIARMSTFAGPSSSKIAGTRAAFNTKATTSLASPFSANGPLVNSSRASPLTSRPCLAHPSSSRNASTLSTHRAAAVAGIRHRALRLSGVPHWVTPSDLKRMAERSGVTGVIDVRIEDSSGLSSGEAVLEFATPRDTKTANHRLENAQISGIPVYISGFAHSAYTKHGKRKVDPRRNGSSATVVVFGFPKEWKLKEVASFLGDYRLDTWGEPEESFEKIYGYGSQSPQSRWAIHLSSMSDAWRLVRHLHMKRFNLGGRTDTLLGARVLY